MVMCRRGILLALLPAASLGFSPTVPFLSVSPRGCQTDAFTTSSSRCSGSFGLAARRETSELVARSRRSSLSMGASLVEEAVTAEQAGELINKARTIVEADMGVKAAGMLSDDFRFLWQFNGELSRADYLTEGKGPYATLRKALPDLFWNAYDFRVDKYQSDRVWATTRLTGTHNGPLVFDGKEYPATGKRVEAAPECVSLVFDKSSGLCTKMTGGFCIDRGAGNTGPAGGIWGILQAIGEPVSAWKYFPPAKVLGDVFGPTFRPKKSLGTSKPPFREAIAIALTKQVLTAGRDDLENLSDLLADDVQIYAPILGPLKKKEFVQSTQDLAGFFSGLDTDDNFYDARVDPLEPSRVWITTRPTNKVIGPIEAFGLKFEPKRDSWAAGPECLSVTFDKDGYASKITLGCPMDTALGDTNGLCNFLGVLEGMGIPFPEFFSRPAPESFRRLIDSITPEGMKKKPKKPAATKPKPAPKIEPEKKQAAPALSLPTISAGTPTLPKSKPSPPASKGQAKAAPPAKSKSQPKPAAALKKPSPAPAKKSPSSLPTKKPAPSPPAKKPVTAAAPKSAPKPPPAPAKPAPKPAMASSKSKPAASVTSTKSTRTTKSAKTSGSASSSPFGGLFNFGGSGGRGGSGGSKADTSKDKDAGSAKQPVPASSSAKKAPAAVKEKPKAPVKQAPAPKKAPAPAAKAKPAPPPPTPAKGKGVEFSPALISKLEAAVGSSQGLNQLKMRTDLYARGGISAIDFLGTLKKTLGPDGAQNLGPDIIGSLPSGNQKSALFKLFSTE